MSSIAFAGSTALTTAAQNTLGSPSLDQRILRVSNLSVQFRREGVAVDAVRGVGFHVDRGETLAIVGESGSGKSVTSLALMRLVEHSGGCITSGKMDFRRRDGTPLDLAQATASQIRAVRGADLAMIFQEPMTSLNPVFPVGKQIAEALRLHRRMDRRAAAAEVHRLLERMRIADAKRIAQRYPHQLSGGMRQRVMIAMALSCQPMLLIADEPTTALDVTIQAQILYLIRELQTEQKMGVIFITHDMAVVAEMADRVLVMYRGEKVEENAAAPLLSAPAHPYTQALLAAVPRLGAMRGTDAPQPFPRIACGKSAPDAPIAPPASAATTQPAPCASSPTAAHSLPGATAAVLQVKNLVTRFPVRGGLWGRPTGQVHAVEQVSFDLYPGETLALVGESGCGKSTTGRSLLRLVDIQSGSIVFAGQAIEHLRGPTLQALRRHIQFIFQDPFASLNPRLTVGFSIMEPLLIHRIARGEAARLRVARLLEKVGLPADAAQRYPHEFSGGQRQRIAIARALALEPKVVIADEAVSALDVSVRAQVINLMLDLQRELGVAYLFISHDMAVVERISHRVAVMYLGQIVELGPRHAVFESPQHPYTQKLMAAVPLLDPTRRHSPRVPQMGELPSSVRALGDEPTLIPLREVTPGHFVRLAA